MTPHRYQFFVAARGCAVGDVVGMGKADRRHLAVLRASPGDRFDAVDDEGRRWDAELVDGEGGSLRLVAELAALPGVDDGIPGAVAVAPEPRIHLIAGVLTGARFDALADAAVQAGVTAITPLARDRREQGRVAERLPRLARVVESAAKQARRPGVPDVGAPVLDGELLLEGTRGIVLHAAADSLLLDVLEIDRALAARSDGGVERSPMTLLVGPSDGLDPALIRRCRQAGWREAHLGGPVLRSELAAAVAVAMTRAVLGREDAPPDG